MKTLFAKHFSEKVQAIFEIMQQESIDSLIIETGLPEYHYLDDQHKMFRPNPHFLYLCPDMGVGHVIKLTLGKKPELYFFTPNGFWDENSELKGDFWEDSFEISCFTNPDDIWKHLHKQGLNNARIISPHPENGVELGCEPACERLLSQIHWLRITKTDYEIECLKKANEMASLGHRQAHKSFLAGRSELEVYNDYLQASFQRESDLPYGGIVAFDKNSAILHYQSPKNGPSGNTFLIDAGARVHGYCSDITRTYTQTNTHPIFQGILESVENNQIKHCSLVKPGVDYEDIQDQAHEDTLEILKDSGIMTVSKDEGRDLNLSQTFFPHGVGHALGIQVHDVGGKQKNQQGETSSESEKHPHLRTLRKLQVNDVVTIEPGFYFIPSLLNNLKMESATKSALNWDLIEELIPSGGIRIEDNVVATKEGSLNLTRPFLP